MSDEGAAPNTAPVEEGVFIAIVGPSGGTASSVQAPTPPDAEAASTQPARERPAWLKFLDSLFGR